MVVFLAFSSSFVSLKSSSSSESAIWDAHVDQFLPAPECLHGLQANVSGEDEIVGVDRGDLDEVKLGNARFDFLLLLWREGARVLGVGNEVIDLAFLRLPSELRLCHRG